MRLFRIVLAVLIAISAASSAQAQGQREWVPRGIEALRQTASSKTEFTLDHSMLVIASRLDRDDEDLQRVIAGVNGVSFHTYHYPQPWMYDPGALDSVKQEYQMAGWHQVVYSHGKYGSRGSTELWIHLQHSAITNIAILVARSKEVTFILVSGSISPLDLLHIGGHFGIPRIEGGVEVPNTRRHPQARPPAPPVAAPGPEAQAADTILEIASTPDDADVELDAAFVGSTPSTITVPAGDHVIAVKKAGYAVWERNLRVTSGGKVRVDAELQPEAPASQPR
jgi:hypothetical protein